MWITTETGIDVNEDFLTTSPRSRRFAAPSSVSRLTRGAMERVHTRALQTCYLHPSASRRPRGCLTACRYVSQTLLLPTTN